MGRVQSITGKTERPEVDPAETKREAAEIEARKREAKYHWAALVNASGLTSKNSLKLGFHAFILKSKNLWGILGYKDEDDARKAADVSRSTWYSVLSLAEKFQAADETLFTSMKLSNAQELADLPESKRQNRQWMEWAGKESIEVFKKRCDVEMDGKARPSDTKEQITQMKITAPASRKQVIDEKTKEYAKAVGINPADQSKVIEVALTEVTGGKSLVEAITNATAKIREAKSYAHSGVSVEDALAVMEKTLDEIVLDFSAALDQASQRTEAA